MLMSECGLGGKELLAELLYKSYVLKPVLSADSHLEALLVTVFFLPFPCQANFKET